METDLNIRIQAERPVSIVQQNVATLAKRFQLITLKHPTYGRQKRPLSKGSQAPKADDILIRIAHAWHQPAVAAVKVR